MHNIRFVSSLVLPKMIDCVLFYLSALYSMWLFGSDIYFIGGFGTVAWVDVKEYEALQPDKIAVDGGEQNLKVLYFKPLRDSDKLETPFFCCPLVN